MKNYYLLIVTILMYALLIVWYLLGITGNEMLYQLIAFCIVPIVFSFISSIKEFDYKSGIITIIICILCQSILPLLMFNTFSFLFIALSAISIICGISIGFIKKSLSIRPNK